MVLSAPPAPGDRRDVVRYVRDLDARLERVDREILLADWNLQTGRSRADSGSWQLRRGQILGDPRLLPWVRTVRTRLYSRADDRRLELLERIVLDAAAEQHPDIVRLRSLLNRRIVAFRPRWKGRRVNRAVIGRVVRSSPSEADRRSAYYAMLPLLVPLEPSLRELIELRNERARALGFRTLAAMRHGFNHLTPARVNRLAETAARLARPRIRGLRDRFEQATGRSGWHPWDFHYARQLGVSLPERWFPRSTMMSRILAAVARWGIPVQRMRFRVVFHDTPVGGLTLAPDPPHDVRILVHPEGGFYRYMVMFHEVGHAVQSASIRSPPHLLRWHENVPGFGAFHEGIGGLFEEIAYSKEWLTAQPGSDRPAVERFVEAEAARGLYDIARTAAWVRIEHLLYEQPDRDPMPDVQRFERQIFGYDPYPRLSFADHFFVEAPLYAPNYVLAGLFASQLIATLRDRFGETLWPNRRVGPWLIENWFAPGSYIDWVPHLQELTGRAFGVEAFRRAHPTH